ncbi:MAG: pentapeptide repeat-containing protein [Alphaproteobacteria bacterium]|nr:pentapeptide repeat-containing protein [Alphaproteobacteria bacterium]
MTTENSNPRFVDLDAWPVADILEAMWEGQASAVAAVRAALPALARAVDAAASALGTKGRLVYAGAGTSGRIAVQDGAELPPTFDWPESRVVFAMAGGPRALTRSAEGAEDDDKAGAAAMRAGRGGGPGGQGVAANLEFGRFWGADFAGANLTRASLAGATFDGADLRGADLRDCVIADARFDGAQRD